MSEFREILKRQQGIVTEAGGGADRLRKARKQGGDAPLNELLRRSREASDALRVVELERRENPDKYKADFEGRVIGRWIKIGPDGEGLVSYKGKTYTTVRVGKTSLFPGDTVQLYYADGFYFSIW